MEVILADNNQGYSQELADKYMADFLPGLGKLFENVYETLSAITIIVAPALQLVIPIPGIENMIGPIMDIQGKLLSKATGLDLNYKNNVLYKEIAENGQARALLAGALQATAATYIAGKTFKTIGENASNFQVNNPFTGVKQDALTVTADWLKKKGINVDLSPASFAPGESIKDRLKNILAEASTTSPALKNIQQEYNAFAAANFPPLTNSIKEDSAKTKESINIAVANIQLGTAHLAALEYSKKIKNKTFDDNWKRADWYLNCIVPIFGNIDSSNNIWVNAAGTDISDSYYILYALYLNLVGIEPKFIIGKTLDIGLAKNYKEELERQGKNFSNDIANVMNSYKLNWERYLAANKWAYMIRCVIPYTNGDDTARTKAWLTGMSAIYGNLKYKYPTDYERSVAINGEPYGTIMTTNCLIRDVFPSWITPVNNWPTAKFDIDKYWAFRTGPEKNLYDGKLYAINLNVNRLEPAKKEDTPIIFNIPVPIPLYPPFTQSMAAQPLALPYNATDGTNPYPKIGYPSPNNPPLPSSNITIAPPPVTPPAGGTNNNLNPPVITPATPPVTPPAAGPIKPANNTPLIIAGILLGGYFIIKRK